MLILTDTRNCREFTVFKLCTSTNSYGAYYRSIGAENWHRCMVTPDRKELPTESGETKMWCALIEAFPALSYSMKGDKS